MKKNFLLLVLVAAILALSVGVSTAAEVKVGADLELVYRSVNIEDKNEVAPDKDEFHAAGYATTDADLNISISIDENTSAFMKIDADDNGDQLEEVWVQFKNVGGLPIDLKIGKQEIPFGMDKDLGIVDPYTHGASGSLLDFDSEDILGEVDNRFGLKITSTPLGDSPKIELSIFENDSDGDGDGEGYGDSYDKPADDGLSQSFAVRLTSTRVAGLTAEVSGIVKHREGVSTLPGNGTDNEDAWSIGLDYKMDPVEVYAEYIAANDIDHDGDTNQDILHIGVAFNATEKITIVAQYGSIKWEDSSDAAVKEEPELTKWSLTPKYKMDNGIELALEYVSEEYDFDDADPDVKDIEADAIFARIKFSL